MYGPPLRLHSKPRRGEKQFPLRGRATRDHTPSPRRQSLLCFLHVDTMKRWNERRRLVRGPRSGARCRSCSGKESAMSANWASSLWASSLVLTLFLGPVTRADEATARDAIARNAIAKLLDIGWGTTPKVRLAADAQYDEVRRLAGATPAALEASLLVLLQQRRYDDADRRSDELLERDPTNLTGRRAKVWMAVVLKDYSAALIATDKLSQQLANDAPRADDEQRIHDELHAFLGRIYGYLGGPVAENVNQDERKELERKIIERITEPRRARFEEARDGVVARFLELTGDKDDERKRVLDEAAAARDKTLKELETEKEAIAGRAKELDGRKDKVQSDLRDELAEIAKDDQPL